MTNSQSSGIIMTTTQNVLEAFAILICKHDIHLLLGNDDDDDFTSYNVLMYLLDRPNSIYTSSVQRISGSKEPDICASCYTYFGHSFGGRLRLGCHHCYDESVARHRLFAFARLTGLDIRQSEVILSNVLYKYLKGEDVS